MEASVMYQYTKTDPCNTIYFTSESPQYVHNYCTTPMHFHECIELVYFSEVNAKMWINGSCTTLKGPHIIYIPPMAVHEFTLEGFKGQWFLIQFNEKALGPYPSDKALPKNPYYRAMDESEYAYVFSFLNWAWGQCETREKKTLPIEALKIIWKWTIQTTPVCPIHTAPIQRDRTAEKTGNQMENQKTDTTYQRKNLFTPLLEYLEDHEIYHISVDKAASLCCLSRSHFMKLFKECFHLTFNKFLLQRRMKAALYMLAHEDIDVTEVSYRLDFSSPAYFSKMFHETFDLTPTEFINSTKGVNFEPLTPA